MRKRERGFTLVELMVVIAIIALLAAILFPNLTKAIQKGRVAAVISGGRNLYTVLSTYYADHGEYPLEETGSHGFVSGYDPGINQKWPWGSQKLTDIPPMAVTGTNVKQSPIIYWSLSDNGVPNAAQDVARDMASKDCPAGINAPAIVVDFRSQEADTAVYVCK